MRRYTFALICGFVLCGPTLAGQDMAVTHARISLKPRSVSIERVTIENLSDVPLVAWEVGVFAPGASSPSLTASSDFFGRAFPPAENSGPIQPHARRVLDVELPDVQSARNVALELAVFANGTYEGVAPSTKRWRQSVQARADENRYWMRAIDEAPRLGVDELRRYFAAMGIERAGQAGVETSTRLRMRIENLTRQTLTLGGALSMLAQLRADAAGELAVLESALGRDSVPPPVTSAAVASERVTITGFVAAVENVGSQPIEAFSFTLVEPGGRGGSGQAADYCTVDVQPGTGHGPIASGEVREITLSSRISQGEPLPSISLKYVLFSDLSFEGPLSERDALLRSREGRAAGVAAALAALEEVAARPGQAEAILTARRLRRAQQAQQDGTSTDLYLFDEMIRQAKRSLPEFVASIQGRRARLERERQQLLRHTQTRMIVPLG
jgi:hypothetical protein